MTPSLLDYFTFFETEPVWMHEMGWFYGARFRVLRGEDQLDITIAPDEMECQLQWWQGERLLMSIQWVSVSEFLLINTVASEKILIKSAERCLLGVLTLKPNIDLNIVMEW